MQGGEGGEDVLGKADPNLAFYLDDLSLEGPGDQASQAAGGAACQKLVLMHHMRYRARRGHEIPLILNLREHIWVLHHQKISALIFVLCYISP